MNLGELIEQFREDADDKTEPYLWSPKSLTRHANDATEEAARRARILLDATTTGVCNYEVKAGAPWITLHHAIIEIRHARLVITNPDCPDQVRYEHLTRAHRRDLQRCHHDWLVHCREPRRYVTDIETGKIRFDSIPVCDATLELEVSRLPIRKMQQEKDCPEIPHRYHRDLVHWMLHRAFGKRDSDTNDQARAAQALADFEKTFGPPSSAIDEQWYGNKPNFRDSDTRFF